MNNHGKQLIHRNLSTAQKPPKKVKGRDIYIPPLTGKPRPAAVYN